MNTIRADESESPEENGRRFLLLSTESPVLDIVAKRVQVGKTE